MSSYYNHLISRIEGTNTNLSHGGGSECRAFLIPISWLLQLDLANKIIMADSKVITFIFFVVANKKTKLI